jgi:hypothetical protein
MQITDMIPVFAKMLTMHTSVRERMTNYCYHVTDADITAFDDTRLTTAYLRGFAAITTQPEGEITQDQISEALGHLVGWV